MDKHNENTFHSFYGSWKIWTNPIIRRYCRSRLRPKALIAWGLIVLIMVVFIFAVSRSAGSNQMELVRAEAERMAFIPIFILQAVIMFVLGMAQTTGGITAEADEGVIDYQRLVPMTPLAKVLGYLFGLPIREYVLFLLTIPFTIWTIWKGEIVFTIWLPLYVVFFTSAWLYHLTGLVTGTVVKNRRWSFLASMGIVFCLYTIIPQLAKIGLVFFKYLTVRPTLEEVIPYLLPDRFGGAVRLVQSMDPSVKFFNLNFPESVFTVFTQLGLIITSILILTRHWKRKESFLLSKIEAVFVFAWLQLLLLGNALPSIDAGKLFPSYGLTRNLGLSWKPSAEEAVMMSGVYGLATILFIYMFSNIISPSRHKQIMGWRRANKAGSRSMSFRDEGSSAFGYVLIMILCGTAAWTLFTQALVESRWFPGHSMTLETVLFFLQTLATAALCFHALLESRERKSIFLAGIFIGVLPFLIGIVLLSIDKDAYANIVMWIFGISPLSSPFYAAFSELDIYVIDAELRNSLPAAFRFWQMAYTTFAFILVYELFKTRRQVSHDVLKDADLISADKG